jgi:hypothetical protein
LREYPAPLALAFAFAFAFALAFVVVVVVVVVVATVAPRLPSPPEPMFRASLPLEYRCDDVNSGAKDHDDESEWIPTPLSRRAFDAAAARL